MLSPSWQLFDPLLQSCLPSLTAAVTGAEEEKEGGRVAKHLLRDMESQCVTLSEKNERHRETDVRTRETRVEACDRERTKGERERVECSE